MMNINYIWRVLIFICSVENNSTTNNARIPPYFYSGKESKAATEQELPRDKAALACSKYRIALITLD